MQHLSKFTTFNCSRVKGYSGSLMCLISQKTQSSSKGSQIESSYSSYLRAVDWDSESMQASQIFGAGFYIICVIIIDSKLVISNIQIMFESKVSTVRSVWGDFSSINTSNAPGFVPIPCPTHQEYSITNICKSTGCIEPLCPQCITTHVELHQQTKKPAKIENIITTRVTVIEQLAKLKYEGQKELDEHIKNGLGNIDDYLQSQYKKLDIAEKKVLKMVQELFQEMKKNMEIISSAFYTQKDKKQKQCRYRSAPLSEYLDRIVSYKEQVQSDDYIPALIQLLNQPPKKPKVESVSPIQNYGSVQINEKYLDDLKNDLKKFIKVEVNCKDEGKVNLGRSNYHASNNMKFSRFDRSRSIDGQMRRSTSRSKIFGKNESINSSNVRPELSKGVSFANYEKAVEVEKQNYFTKEGLVVYFRENSKNCFQANLDYVEAGFDKIQLDIHFLIPANHRTIITPNSQVFIIGGEKSNGISSQIYQLENKNCLQEKPSMHEERSQFGACFHSGAIYVFGGLKNKSGYSNWANRSVTNGCEKYCLSEQRWQKIRPMNEGSYNFDVCAFNDKILKFGGITENGESIGRIDIYYTELNQWKMMPMHDKIQLNSRIGTVQTSQNSLTIFGGFTEKGERSGRCYNIKENNGTFQIYVGTSLYNEATFEMSFIHKRSIYALQDGEANRSKLIMNYKNQQWKFISC